MPLIDLNKSTQSFAIPDEIARDSEITAAIAAHVAVTDPHPIYLTQTEGDGRYRQTATPLADADIPAAIARDAEMAAAVNNATGNFGQIFVHSQFSDANTPVVQRGWSFIYGAANTPTNQQLYRLNTALGSEYGIGTYALEIGIPRFGDKRLFTRRQEGGAWDNWEELKIGSQAIPEATKLTFQSTGNIASGVLNTGINIESANNGSAAYLNFHRPGYYYANFGIDTDNQLKVGNFGGSGGIAYKIWHEGNLAAPQHLSKLITGNCPSVSNQMIQIAHNLTIANIWAFHVMVKSGVSGGWVSANFDSSQGEELKVTLYQNVFAITTYPSSRSASLYNQPIKILVFYSP